MTPWKRFFSIFRIHQTIFGEGLPNTTYVDASEIPRLPNHRLDGFWSPGKIMGFQLPTLTGWQEFWTIDSIASYNCGCLRPPDMGVSLNGAKTPISHPKCWSFLVGRTHGLVGGLRTILGVAPRYQKNYWAKLWDFETVSASRKQRNCEHGSMHWRLNGRLSTVLASC